MNASHLILNQGPGGEAPYALRREGRRWDLTFDGRRSSFQHELGALYVAYLLQEPAREPVHGVALAINARVRLWQPVSAEEVLQQRAMGLEDAATVQALWRRQRELEGVLEDRLEIEAVKAEAQQELEEIIEHLRQNSWRTRHGAERCARAAGVAMQRFCARLAAAVDAEGRSDEVLRAFAAHLHEYLLAPSRRGGAGNRDGAWTPVGCFIYVPPRAVRWAVQCPESEVQSRVSADCGMRGAEPTSVDGRVRNAELEVQSPQSAVQSPKSGVRRSRFIPQPRPAAADYLSRFLCVAFALLLGLTGCAGPRPLKGGKAVTTHKPAGITEQTLVQSENPAQATRQDQESVKVRSYTVPAGSRLEAVPATAGAGSGGQECPRSYPQSSICHPQSSPVFVLSAPMPVVEREEARARTELGAAQRDTAREVGARLASLKGIVWVGVGLFVFGLASLVWLPLKVVIGSVTTSAAMMLGGVALMVLPSLIVGNELLILGVVALAVGTYFLAHRHGHLRGQLRPTDHGTVAYRQWRPANR